MNKLNHKIEFFYWMNIIINLTHITQSLMDQGLLHLRKLDIWFLARDFGFLIGDFVCLILSLVFLSGIKNWKLRFQDEKKYIIGSILIIISTNLFLSNVTYRG